MDEEDIRKEAEEIDNELKQTKEEVKKSKIIWWILAPVLALLIIMMAVPYYSVRLDPEPKNIPAIEDVLPADIELSNESIKINDSSDFQRIVNPSDVLIKQTSDIVVSLSCAGNRICQAKAIYYFVRDNINYVSDPKGEEYVEEPREVLATKSADCESGAILLASMLESIGIETRIVTIPNHAFLKIRLNEALNKYKMPDTWIYLDWTCKSCDFGKIPVENVEKII